jgi:transcription initiation factor TFIID subunit 11
MENFLSNTNEHNASFFQPPQQDEESEVITDPQQLPLNSSIIKTDVKVDRQRANLKIDEEANIKLQVLVSNFSDEQLDRYEMYRRSAFSKVSIKRLMHSITGSVPSSNVVIAMAGIAKVFVGEIVEEGLEVQRKENPNETKSTPLEPKHLREANRRINNNNNHCPPK